jgi:hypothetical protein
MTEKQTKMIEELELEIENIVQDKTKNHFAIKVAQEEIYAIKTSMKP